jgi:UDP-2,3-diacylglucosamine hydrolase
MVYFISDVHLGIETRRKDIIRENLLLDFLDCIAGDCRRLYIVGDLFDYWFEYKTVIPKFFYRTLSKLYDLRHKGIEIKYVMGNHDFGHFFHSKKPSAPLSFFEDELDIPIIKDDFDEIIDGKRFFISHGDGKAYNDGVYNAIKKILRSPLNLYLYKKLHPDCGIGLASRSSKKSRSYTDSKDYGPRDGLEDFALKKIDEGFDFVVMGHRHRLVCKEHGKGLYINLGDWLRIPHYGAFDGDRLHLLKVEDLLKR